jgi:hypothetical protein
VQYCRFQTQQGPQYGEVSQRQGNWWMERIIPAPPEDTTVTHRIENFAAQPLSALTLLAPVTPSKIVCIGRN